LEKLQLKQAIFYSALDEPLFKFFGGDRISSMIEKLGLSENEAIEHQMISTAIKNAQEKISKQVVIDYSAQSQAGWFSKNIVK
jgi:preprotein translocase subunit SecA